MERIKIMIAYSVFIFSLFDLSYEKKVEVTSNKFKSNIKNLSSVPNLEKTELKNFVIEYNNEKMKNLRISISSNPNIYNKKIGKLEIEEKKSPNIYKVKSSVVKKDYNIKTNPSNIMHIEKNIPYLSNIYIYNGGKQNKLVSSAYSFIEEKTSELIDHQLLNDYRSLIKQLDENYKKGRDSYIKLLSYKETEKYYLEKEKEYYQNFQIRIVPAIDEIIKSAEEYINYCKKSKDDIKKKMNELELIENVEKVDTITQKIDAFKSDIVVIKEKLNKDFESIEKKREDVYKDVDTYLKLERIKVKQKRNVRGSYRKTIESYLGEMDSCEKCGNLTKECENFLESDSKLLKIKNKNFYHKKYKHTLKLLMEEINDIITISKENEKIISDNFASIKDMQNNVRNFVFDNNNITEKATSLSIAYYNYIFAEKSCQELKLNFEKKKGEIYVLFDNIAKELGDEINSLVYPSEIESKNEKIYSQSKEILSYVDRMIHENCEILEDLSYSNQEISAIINKIIQLYSQIGTHNISLKREFHSINEKYNSFKSEKCQIETWKQNLPIDNQKILIDITENVHAKKKNIEDIIASSNKKNEELERNFEALKSLKDEIEELIKKIKTEKEILKELKTKEDEQIKQAVGNIEQELENIGRKISKLKSFMDLKCTENKDIKIIEKVIDESSFDNKSEYTTKKEIAKEKMETAVRSLFHNGKIEKTYNEIPNYISEKKRVNYMIYDLNTINSILGELKQKSTEIDNIIEEGTTIMEGDIASATKNLSELRDNIITESIEDLHNKMKNSHETFNQILSFINDSMIDYKKKKDKFKDFEEDIKKKKISFFDNLVEEDSDTLEGKDTFQETFSLNKIIKENENLILTKISEARNIVSIYKEQFEIYKKIEEHEKILNNHIVFGNLKALKEKIIEINADKKLNDYQRDYESVTSSIDDSIEKVRLSKKIIEDIKVLNKVINESNKNGESIENLRRNLKELEEKLNRHYISIEEDSLIENNVKENLLSELRKKKKIVEDQMKPIDESEKKSKDLLESSADLKKNGKNSLNEKNITIDSENISRKKKNLETIIGDIASSNVRINTLSLEVDNLINTQNNEIANMIYSFIMELYQEISKKIVASSRILEVAERGFKKYKFEKDIKNVIYNNNKEKLNEIWQSFSELKNNINIDKEKIAEIQHKFKSEVDNSNNLKKYNEKFNEKRNNMKRKYEKMKKELEDHDKVDIRLQNTLAEINEKKLEYKKILVYDYLDQITDVKRRAEEEIKTIDLYKEKIKQLEENIPDIEKCSLESLNYEDYVSGAKRDIEEINRLEKDVKATMKNISTVKVENDIYAIQINVEGKLKEVINKKSKIDYASKTIKHIEMMLTSTTFSVVMQDIENNAQLVKKEEENAKKEFTESENAKRKVLDYLKNAEELRDLLTHNLDEDLFDKKIEEIRLVRKNIKYKIKDINVFLSEAEKHKVASSFYFNNIIRGKDKIIYLKNNDEEKILTDQVMENVNRYVVESENYSNKAAKYTEETHKNYELSLKYREKMNDILNDSIILAEKMKIEMKKNYVTDILIKMQNGYYDNIYLLKGLKKRLIRLEQEDINMQNEDEANNEKSIDAFTKIQITRINANQTLLDKEKLKNRIINIISDAENEMNSFYTIVEKNYESSLNELEIGKDNLEKISKVLENFEEKKKFFDTELNYLKDIETITATLEDQMVLYKKFYEEGILEEIKKIAEEYKKNIDVLIKSIKLTIDTSITFLKNSALKENVILQKFKDPERKMNEIYDSFNKSYKEIEKEALMILESSKTYNDLKEKKEKAKVEKEKLIEFNKEMKNLLNNINDIRINEILRLILYMKNELDNVNENAKEEYTKLGKYSENIKRNLENIINSNCTCTALIEIDNAKNKISKFKERKIVHSSYKDKAYLIYDKICKIISFIDMNIESTSILEGYKDIENAEDIVLSIQGDSFDINNKEKENEENIIIMEDIYEKIKIRDELKKKIKNTRYKVDKTLRSAQDSLENFKKIKVININEEYDEILRNSKEYGNFKKIISFYEEKYNKIQTELKTDEIVAEFNKYGNFLNDLGYFIEILHIKKFTEGVIEKVEDYINIIENKVVDTNNNILGINSYFYKLLELREKCKLHILSLAITAINSEMSNDSTIIEKRKNNAVECVEYVVNSYNSINYDIYTTNECFHRNIISIYELNGVEHLNNLKDELKKNQQKVIERINDIKKLFLRANEKKNSIYVDKNLLELKILYKEFKQEKNHLKKIYKKINETKLKEMENSSKKFVDIAESYKNVIENEKRYILDLKNYLEKIEYFMKGEYQKLLLIKPIDTKEKILQLDEFYNLSIYIFIEIYKYENHNNSENKKMMNHIKQISYLIERTIFLMKDTELYQCENYDELSEEENKEILNDVNDYKKRTKSKIEESRRIFESIMRSIDQNKIFIHENNNMIHSIYNIVIKVNNIIQYYEKEIIEKGEYNEIKIHLNTTNKIKDKNILITNNVGNDIQYNEMGSELYSQNKENSKSKLDNGSIKLIGTLIALLICYGVLILIVYKSNNRKINYNNKSFNNFAFSNNAHNSYKEGDTQIYFNIL
ncbi:reticulocyte binding protein, putative [Plasmodium relictum]|uniref:Reticulocyte binding protein, putative n=1 Tax=Plasmodium relictum TaxID=85471 RepID=A0A1J1GKG4_PLARL|nr:reticulocyte binding protein, putative [Plasmodium relictum]CRG85332.1 reticulocyte binding protein, putative [Plasmodium relictum]